MLFIPILGTVISYISGIFSYGNYSIGSLIGGIIYFILVSFLIWRGCQWIHGRIRHLYSPGEGTWSKILFVSFLSSVYALTITGISGLAWLKMSEEPFSWAVMNKFILLSILAVFVFTLVYEVLYLSKERELDNKIVKQLDNELTRAEMIALRNELDPHFIYNSLNILSHFINTDSSKAARYNQMLAHLYQYFLKNSSKEVVEAKQEIDFIQEYFELLKMVYETRLSLTVEVSEVSLRNVLLLPCSLQLLVENATKHNTFTKELPLRISVSMEGDYIVVKNTLNPKTASASTGIGLKNLQSQYHLISGKNIVLEKSDSEFVVRLPLIKMADKRMLRLSMAG